MKIALQLGWVIVYKEAKSGMTPMVEDIRNRLSIVAEDILGLNFIRTEAPYVFRRHYRQGLRSHVIEVLPMDDFERETTGVVMDGIRIFPKARPVKMLRIFRTRFASMERAVEEVRRVKLVEKYLGPDCLALSNEFLVDYWKGNKRDLMLCGLQEYVEGVVVDPWSAIQHNLLEELLQCIQGMGLERRENAVEIPLEKARERARVKADQFIRRMKAMIWEIHYVPDLAGIENLIFTAGGNIKLVDINNISPVSFGPSIYIDDKGYPICDKSIEALSLLEQKLLDRPIDHADGIYRIFLDPERISRVKALERAFHEKFKDGRLL
jgi:hypothetical protein